MTSLRVALCQINTTVGDLTGNADKVLEWIESAEAAGCDVAVFPEMTIPGYPPEDLLLKPGFIAENRTQIERIARESNGHCAAIVGFADGDSDVYNSLAVLSGGTVVGTYHKRHLPNYDVFDEERTHSAGNEAMNLFRIAGINVGVSICEDAWIAGGPVSQSVAGGAQVAININGSPYRRGKMALRKQVLTDLVDEGACPIVYLNLVGGQDELIFDGGSMVMDSTGVLIAKAHQFVEDFVVVDIEVAEPSPIAMPFPILEVTPRQVERSRVETTLVEWLDPMAELYEALLLATRDYIAKTGFSDICLGLSGGIDSALVAAIAVDALGAEHVHVVLMPSRYSSDHSVTDAEILAKNFGVDHRAIPIEAAHRALLEMLEPSFDGLEPDVTEENLQSRIRGVLLMALANKFGWLVLTTGNKSEAAVGYSTLYGDTAGAYACIKDVYKLDVYRLARYVNDRAGREMIPESTITKAPSAELRPDQRDDQSLPPYEELDPLLEAYIEGDATIDELAIEFDPAVVDRIVRLVDIAEYKRRQTPVGPRVTTKGFGRDRRLPIVNRFR
ncbi:MAG: NAD+ synthase [Acidimicrobiales bacterium]